MKNSIIGTLIVAIILILCFFAENVLDNFVDLSLNNAPWLLLAFLIICAVIIIIALADRLKGAYRKNSNETKKYVKQQVKVTIISFVIAIVIMSVIVASVIFG